MFCIVFDSTCNTPPLLIFPVIFHGCSKEPIEESDSHQKRLSENPVNPFRYEGILLASVKVIFVLKLLDHNLQATFSFILKLLIFMLLGWSLKQIIACRKAGKICFG
jgi:hypothetical protein